MWKSKYWRQKSGVGIWVDSLMIPRDAQNVANAHKYINHTLNPETAAKNGNYVTYAPASRPARDLMDEKYTSDASIFPNKELMEKSFIVSSQNQPMRANSAFACGRL